MKCSEAQSLIKPYLEADLTDDKLEPFLKHIRSCASCHEDLEIYMAVYGVLNDDDDGDYNFVKALDDKLTASEHDLEQRTMRSSVHRIIMLSAEIILAISVFMAVQQHLEQRSRIGRLPAVTVDETETLLTEAWSEQSESVYISRNKEN